MEGLTIGRIVRYLHTDGVEYPAIVTGVLKTNDGTPLEKGTCQLTVFHPGYEQHVTTDHGMDIGQWHWREEEAEKENPF